jgi:hypothetical protein
MQSRRTMMYLFITFVTEVCLYSREAEPQIERILYSEISQKIFSSFPFCTRHAHRCRCTLIDLSRHSIPVLSLLCRKPECGGIGVIDPDLGKIN